MNKHMSQIKSLFSRPVTLLYRTAQMFLWVVIVPAGSVVFLCALLLWQNGTTPGQALAAYTETIRPDGHFVIPVHEGHDGFPRIEYMRMREVSTDRYASHVDEEITVLFTITCLPLALLSLFAIFSLQGNHHPTAVLFTITHILLVLLLSLCFAISSLRGNHHPTVNASDTRTKNTGRASKFAFLITREHPQILFSDHTGGPGQIATDNPGKISIISAEAFSKMLSLPHEIVDTSEFSDRNSVSCSHIYYFPQTNIYATGFQINQETEQG